MFVTTSQGAAATISGGIFYSTDTTGTNARASRITITPSSAGTNLLAGTLTATNQAWVSSTLTNANLSVGTGDDLNYVPAAGFALPYRLEIRAGTSASPFTNAQPLIKFDRTEQMTAANMYQTNGSVAEQNAVLNIQASGSATTEAQVTGIYAVSQSASTQARINGVNPDAGGIAGTGRIIGSGTGRGIGGYFVGRTDSASGLVNGAEVRSWNESGADMLYNPTGNSSGIGLLVSSASAGGNLCGTAYQVNTTGNGSKYHVGLGFPRVGGADTIGGYLLIESQSAMTNGIVLAGTHEQAFSTGTTAGTVSIGRTNNTPINSGVLLEVFKSGSQSPLFAVQGNNATDAIASKIGNGAGSAYDFVSGGTGQFLSDSVQGDTGVSINTTNKSWRVGGGGNATVIQVQDTGSAGQLGFYGTAAVAKQNTDPQTALINYGLLVNSPLSGPENNITIYDEMWGTLGGVFDWSTGVSGTAAAWTAIAATSARPGINQFQSGTATNGTSGIRTSGNTILFGGGRQILKTAIRIPTLSDGTDAFTVFVGFHDVNGAVGEAVDGAYFTYSSSTTYYLTNTSAGSWVGKTANNSARSETAPSAAVVGNQWYVLAVDVNAAGTQADFYIDGVLLGSLTTNIPTAANRNTAHAFKIEKQAGTNSRNLDCDYCWWNFKPTVAR